MNNKYLGTEYVRILKDYVIDGVSMTRGLIIGTGEEKMVKTSELTEKPSFDKVDNQIRTKEEVEEKTPIVEEEHTEKMEEPVVEEKAFTLQIRKVRDKDWLEFGQFNELLEIEESLKDYNNFDVESIERVLKGEQKTHKGFQFRVK